MNPTNEHREQAREIIKAHRRHSVVVRAEQLTDAIASALVARDAEVREVLEGLRNVNGCWCAVNIGHSESCSRTQHLYTKLQPKENGDADDKTVSR